MSIESAALELVNTTLLATSGENVTFRGATVAVTIDKRDNFRFDQRGDAPRGDESRVVILNSALAALTPATLPRPGEFFVAGNGATHHIARVKRIDEEWQCDCNKSFPAAAP